MNKKTLYGLIVIFIISFSLRVYRIGKYPSLLWDEAALGYNGYSILKTGKDEYGKTLPLIFKSFGDYKPGFYVYLTIPFIALFGLNPFAVRLPSIVLGALTPIFLFLLVKQLTKNKRLSLLSAFVLAVTPWHIHFSRGAWESNIMSTFLVLASHFFLMGIKKYNHYLLNLSGFIFLLSLLTYQGAKLIVPLIIFGLLITNFKQLKNQFNQYLDRLSLKTNILYTILAAGVISWYLVSFTGVNASRLEVMSIFSYKQTSQTVQKILNEHNLFKKNLHFYLFHGQWLHYARGILSRYLNHFSPRYLGFMGDWQSNRHSAPYFGMIGRLGLVLFIYGLYRFVAAEKSLKKHFLVYWLVASPLPAALSRDQVSGVRSLPMSIALAFFIGYGLYQLTKINLNQKLKYLLYVFLIGLFIVDFSYYLDLYHNHLVANSPQDWLYGHQQVVKKINSQDFNKVYMTNFYGQPYIYYLFYSQYPPSEYQQKANLIQEGSDIGRVKDLDNIKFQAISIEALEHCNDCLLILSEDEIYRQFLKEKGYLDQLQPIGGINNNYPFYAYETK